MNDYCWNKWSYNRDQLVSRGGRGLAKLFWDHEEKCPSGNKISDGNQGLCFQNESCIGSSRFVFPDSHQSEHMFLYTLTPPPPPPPPPLKHRLCIYVTGSWSQVCLLIFLIHKSHNAPDRYRTMHQFVMAMCTCVHISVTKWSIVGYVYVEWILGFVRWV